VPELVVALIGVDRGLKHGLKTPLTCKTRQVIFPTLNITSASVAGTSRSLRGPASTPQILQAFGWKKCFASLPKNIRL